MKSLGEAKSAMEVFDSTISIEEDAAISIEEDAAIAQVAQAWALIAIAERLDKLIEQNDISGKQGNTDLPSVEIRREIKRLRYYAFEKQESLNDNPFEEGSYEFSWWRIGYEMAQEEIVKKGTKK